MPLRSARLTGDPVLENCLAGTHRMLDGEQGLQVLRVQSALLDLGRAVGPQGADGIFGAGTGTAVSTYKSDKGLSPADPVVGPGTAKALDDDLFIDPPTLDPTFAEFSPAVVDHRLEQFVALELNGLLQGPFDSYRHMLGRFALDALNSGLLLGIVATSRATDLRDAFLAAADPIQADAGTGLPIAAADFFDDAAAATGAQGLTVTFTAGGALQAFIIVQDEIILGRAVITRTSDNTTAPVTTLGVVVHELTHVRNLQNIRALLSTVDTDGDAYADTALATARSAVTGRATARTLRSFVAELTARHVHWIVLRELAGTPGGIAVRQLAGERLAAAALLYFVELTRVYDVNGYGAGINAQGDAVRFPQLDRWLRLCAAQSFSDNADDDAQSRLAFQAAAKVCLDQLATPDLDFSDEDGLFPLIQDFH
jgi:hypothetical protein